MVSPTPDPAGAKAGQKALPAAVRTSRSRLSPRSVVELPFRLGFAATGVAIAGVESAVSIARLTAGSVQHEVNTALGISGDEVGSARAPLTILAQVAELLAPDRPFGRIIAPGGPLERLLVRGGVVDRLTARDGILEKLTAPGGLLDQMTEDNGILTRLASKGGPLDQLTRSGGVIEQLTASEGILERLTSEGGVIDKLSAPDGMLDKATMPGGILDRLVEDDGLLDQLVGEGGAIERAIAPGGPLDRISELTEVISQLAPNLLAMQETVHELAETVELLNASVAPLGNLADRLPKRLTRGAKGHIDASTPYPMPRPPQITG
ncbi:MAG: hypothetical protein QM662_05825 [Gordonia sp. (in: high G+C Gram-positive bacteria)]